MHKYKPIHLCLYAMIGRSQYAADRVTPVPKAHDLGGIQ